MSAPEPVLPVGVGDWPDRATAKVSGMAITSLVLGILSLGCGFLSGIIGLTLGIVSLAQIAGSNGRLRGSGLAIAGIVTSILFSLISFIIALPLVISLRAQARDLDALARMHTIGIACNNFESSFQKFPANIHHRDTGQPLLSWRVAILPYLEQSNAYKQFRLDEPWDSAHNLEAANQMPEIYHRPGLSLERGMTVYNRAMGNGALFDTPIRGQGERSIARRNVLDGTSNTILILESTPDNAAFWTKPSDHEFDPAHPFTGLAAGGLGKFLFVMADGSAVSIPKPNLTSEKLRHAFTRAGGEPFRMRELIPGKK